MLVGCPRCGRPLAGRDLDPYTARGRCVACGEVKPAVGVASDALPDAERAGARLDGAWRFDWSRAQRDVRFTATYRTSVVDAARGTGFGGLASGSGIFAFFASLLFHPEIGTLGIAVGALSAGVGALLVPAYPRRIGVDRERVSCSGAPFRAAWSVPLREARGFRAEVPLANEQAVTSHLYLDTESYGAVEILSTSAQGAVEAARDRLNVALFVARAPRETDPYRGAA